MIGRAYYAVFLHARQRLVGLGWLDKRLLKSGRVHRIVNKRIKRADQLLASLVMALRMKRNAADYVLDQPMVRADAQTILEIARRAWQRIGQLQ